MITAASYSSSEELFAAAKARRARLWHSGAKTRAVPANDCTARIEDLRPYQPRMNRQPPEWKRQDTQFDAHVWLWREEMVARNSAPMKAYILRRSRELGFTYADIVSEKRFREIAAARQLIMWELKNNHSPSPSLPEIARVFGGKDHTTVLHGIRKVEKEGVDVFMARINFKRTRTRSEAAKEMARQYSRDYTRAEKLGLTVKQYREQMAKENA